MEFECIGLGGSDFPQLGEDFARDMQVVKTGKVGFATTLFMPQRDLVDYAVKWMETHRKKTE